MLHAIAPDGTKIAYETFGSGGRDVVLVQGLGLSARFWFDLPERLAADGFRVTVLDNRGTGESGRPRGTYRMATLADDVGAVLDAASIESADLVGISLGGMIAQHVALRHPARLRGLVLLATTPGLPHGKLPEARMLATLFAVALARGNVGQSLFPRLLLSERDLPRARELLAEWPAALEREPHDPRTFFSQFAAAIFHSTGRRLGAIDLPTVVATGTDDLLIPAENSHVLASRIPGARLMLLPDIGHAIPLVDETVVARALRALDEMRACWPSRRSVEGRRAG